MFPEVSVTMGSVDREQERLSDLGDLVVSRRVSVGHPTRESLARAMGVSARLLGDIEKGRRVVGSSSYAQLEGALRWRAGSIREFLESGNEPSDVEAGGAGTPVWDPASGAQGMRLERGEDERGPFFYGESALDRLTDMASCLDGGGSHE